jgi:hypothetical protein
VEILISDRRIVSFSYTRKIKPNDRFANLDFGGKKYCDFVSELVLLEYLVINLRY